MNNLDQSIREIVSASIVSDGKRIFAAPAPVYALWIWFMRQSIPALSH
jgi:hypothetical protein